MDIKWTVLVLLGNIGLLRADYQNASFDLCHCVSKGECPKILEMFENETNCENTDEIRCCQKLPSSTHIAQFAKNSSSTSAVAEDSKKPNTTREYKGLKPFRKESVHVVYPNHWTTKLPKLPRTTSFKKTPFLNEQRRLFLVFAQKPKQLEKVPTPTVLAPNNGNGPSKVMTTGELQRRQKRLDIPIDSQPDDITTIGPKSKNEENFISTEGIVLKQLSSTSVPIITTTTTPPPSSSAESNDKKQKSGIKYAERLRKFRERKTKKPTTSRIFL